MCAKPANDIFGGHVSSRFHSRPWTTSFCLALSKITFITSLQRNTSSQPCQTFQNCKVLDRESHFAASQPWKRYWLWLPRKAFLPATKGNKSESLLNRWLLAFPFKALCWSQLQLWFWKRTLWNWHLPPSLAIWLVLMQLVAALRIVWTRYMTTTPVPSTILGLAFYM